VDSAFLGSYLFLGISFVLSIFCAIGGLWFVRRNVSRELLMNHHDVAAAMLSIIGTLYAVVLGLVVVGSLTKFEQARGVVGREAASLRDVFTLSSGLPKPVARQIHQLCIDYSMTVLGEEWLLMEAGEHSAKADKILEALISAVVTFKPSSSGESNIQSSLFNEANDLDDSRCFRTMLASPAFDPIVWSVLITGGIVLVIFTYFFGVENFRMQILMTSLVTVVLALNMVLVAMFAYPFSGDVHVKPIPFQTDLTFFEQVQAQETTAP